MSVDQIASHVNESQQRLIQLLEIINLSQSRGDAARDELAGQISELGPMEQRLDEQFHAVREAAESASNEAGQRSTELTAVLEALGTLGAAEGQNLENISEKVCTALEAVQQEFDSQVESFSTALEELSTRLEEACRHLEEAKNDIDEIAAESEESITALGSTLEEMTRGFDEAAGAAEEILQELTSDGEGELLGTIGEAFDDLDEVIEAEIEGTLIEDLEGFASQCQDLKDDFGSESDSIAQQLEDRLKEIITNLKDHAEEEIRSQLEAALERLIQEVLTAFATEIVEAILMTQIGVTTTSSLSTILPELIAAKKLLELINDAMSMIPG